MRRWLQKHFEKLLLCKFDILPQLHRAAFYTWLAQGKDLEDSAPKCPVSWNSKPVWLSADCISSWLQDFVDMVVKATFWFGFPQTAVQYC